MSTVEIIPRNDLLDHVDGDNCPCLPRTEYRGDGEFGDGWIVIHNAWDGRE